MGQFDQYCRHVVFIEALRMQEDVEMHLPACIGDYTDFYLCEVDYHTTAHLSQPHIYALFNLDETRP